VGRQDTKDPAVVVAKAYDLALWLLPKCEKYPRNYRFSVGERTVAAMLDVLTLLVEASYTARREPILQDANRKANHLRYLLRLAKDLKLLSVDSYGYAAERLEEIGRMTGGWLKSGRTAATNPAQTEPRAAASGPANPQATRASYQTARAVAGSAIPHPGLGPDATGRHWLSRQTKAAPGPLVAVFARTAAGRRVSRPGAVRRLADFASRGRWAR